MTTHERRTEEQVKMHFLLQQDEDGYPPMAVESVWAYRDEGPCYRLDNIPWFANQATLDDVVEANEDEGVLYYASTVRSSGNSLIRVLYHEGTDPSEVRRPLAEMGCVTELCGAFPLIAVSVPMTVDLRGVQVFLSRGAEESKWEYEEPILRQ
jgi:hypothetical protein